MIAEQKSLKKILSIITAAAISAALGLLALEQGGVYPFGDNALMFSDGVLSTPYSYYIWDVLHGQKSLFFDWNTAFGLNMSGVLHHFGRTSIISLLYGLFPRERIVESLSWLFLLRLVLMNLSMRFFLERRYKTLGEIWKVLICVSYSSCVWVLHYACFFQFIDAAVWLPAMAACLLELLERNRGGVGYVCFLVLILTANVQQCYQILLFNVLLGGLYIHIAEPLKSNRAGMILRLGIYTFIAIGVSAAITLPSMLETTQGYRLAVPLWVQLYDIPISNFTESYYDAEKLAIIRGLEPFWALTAAMAVYYGIKSRSWKLDRKTWFCIILTVLVVIPVFAESIHKIWQAGKYNQFPLRNGYIIPFSTLICLAQLLSVSAKTLKPGRRLENLLGCGLMAGILLLSYFRGLYYFDADMERLSIFEKEQWLYDNRQIMADNKLERVKNSDAVVTYNFQSISDVSSNSSFIGMLSATQMNQNAMMGYGQVFQRLGDIGGTAFTDALLGYKYSVSAQPMNEELYRLLAEDEGILLYENTCTFPVGFFIDQPQNIDMTDMTRADYQNAVSRAILGYDVLDVDSYSMKDGAAQLHVDGKRAVYAFFLRQSYDAEINVTSQKSGESAVYNSSYFKSGMIELGVFEDDTVDISFRDDVAEEILICTLDLEKLNASIPAERVVDYTVGNRSLTLQVDNSEDSEQILFLPINDGQGGWRCRVNGRNTEIQVVYEQFMGIAVPANTISTIEMSYTPPGFILACVISFFSILCLIAVTELPLRRLWDSRVLNRLAAWAFNVFFFTFMIMGYGVDLLLLCGYKLLQLF